MSVFQVNGRHVHLIRLLCDIEKANGRNQGGAWTRLAVLTASLGSNQVTEYGGEQYEDEWI